MPPARRQVEARFPGFAWLGLGVLACVVGADAALARRQDAVQIPTPAQIRLERFLGDAAARTDEYFSLFQDLTAEETKTIELYRDSGDVSRTRRIVSDLVVYQAQIDNASVAEYRNVRTVDGQPIPERETSLEKMIAARAGAASIRDELRRITKESTRYDLDRTVSGLVISEGLPLQAWARALFVFTVVGNERVEGRTALVLDYRQTAPNARFGFKYSFPSEIGQADPLYRGRLWIDAETAHLLRERREVVVASPAAPSPLVIQSTEFYYKPSRFGVPLPTRIVYTSSLKFDRGQDRALRSVPVFRVTFEYGPFKRFTTNAQEDQLVAAPATRDEEGSGTPMEAARATEQDRDLGPEFAEGAPESGYTYEQLSAARRPAPPPPAARSTAVPVPVPGSQPRHAPPEADAAVAAPPATPPATPARRPTPTPPVPNASKVTVPVPTMTLDSHRPPVESPPAKAPAPAVEPPRPPRRPRLPRAVGGILDVRTAVEVPRALVSIPPLQDALETVPPPPAPAPPVPGRPRAWRPPPS